MVDHYQPRNRDLVLLQLKTGETFIKQLIEQNGAYKFESINGQAEKLEVENDEIESIRKVIVIRLP